ncbi:patatin-like phospholipase family protein [Symbiobacterium thermophilum]|uniref:patatin-like phospholipase family protein n=1 Tax=Symbiobacterium thermophilum TaxID=2734 RepID=UPI0035C6D6AC
MASAPKVGLALGGGFARGMAHIGVLQALVAAGIPIGLVAGTSAGSLVGALYAAGCDPWALEQLAAEMNWRSLVRLRLRRDGLLDTSGLERFLVERVGDLDFRDLRLPFGALATDLLDGQPVLIREGRVTTAVRASCAYPGIFLPVRVGEHTLVDGGLTQPIPARAARSMGADLVIGVELSQDPDPGYRPRNLLDIMMTSLALVQRPLIRASASAADVLIRPDLREFNAIELDHVGEIVARGRQAAEEMIPAIRERLDALKAVARAGSGPDEPAASREAADP